MNDVEKMCEASPLVWLGRASMARDALRYILDGRRELATKEFLEWLLAQQVAAQGEAKAPMGFPHGPWGRNE